MQARRARAAAEPLTLLMVVFTVLVAAVIGLLVNETRLLKTPVVMPSGQTLPTEEEQDSDRALNELSQLRRQLQQMIRENGERELRLEEERNRLRKQRVELEAALEQVARDREAMRAEVARRNGNEAVSPDGETPAPPDDVPAPTPR